MLKAATSSLPMCTKASSFPPPANFAVLFCVFIGKHFKLKTEMTQGTLLDVLFALYILI